METNVSNPVLSLTISQDQIYELLIGKARNAALALGTALMSDEVERLCGRPFAHKTDAQCRRGGSEDGSVHLGGAKIPIKRPRVRKGSEEVPLATYQALRSGDLLDERMLESMMVGVSTRNYDRLVEEFAEKFGTSKSSVSRHFCKASKEDLDAINSSDLSGHSLVAIMIDGIEFGKRMMVVALGVNQDSRKIPLGIREGATENSEVVIDLLTSLQDRGLSFHCARTLFVIDGAKALRKAINKVFGGKAVVQRCYLHKMRNVLSYLDENRHAEFKIRIKKMMGEVRYSQAKSDLDHLIHWLENINTQAAESLKECNEEIITLQKLGVSGNLLKSLASTNLIESLFSIVRAKTSRVKNWNSSPTQRLRWAASTMLEHKKRMRRIRGKDDLPILIAGLNENNIATGVKLA